MSSSVILPLVILYCLIDHSKIQPLETIIHYLTVPMAMYLDLAYPMPLLRVTHKAAFRVWAWAAVTPKFN